MALAMTRKHLSENLSACLAERASKGLKPIGAYAIATKLGEKRPTVNRYLAQLVCAGFILREGSGPATSYRFSTPDRPERAQMPQADHESTFPIRWRPAIAMIPLASSPTSSRAPGVSGP